MVLTRSAKRVSLFDSPSARRDIDRKPRPVLIRRRTSRLSASFEADFHRLQDSDEDTGGPSSDSGTNSGVETEYSHQLKSLKCGTIQEPFEMNRRRLKQRTAEMEIEKSIENSMESGTDSGPEMMNIPDSEISPTHCSSIPARTSKRLSLLNSPATPRSLVRRLSQGKENCSPRWKPKGQRGIKSPSNACIVNPFTPNNRNNPLNKQTSSCRLIRNPPREQLSRYKKDFVELDSLGVGDFGEVYKVRHRIDGCIYAIKRTRYPLKGSRQEVQAVREVCAHAVLGKHENVVRYYSAWSEDDRMLIQSEYCNGKSLQDELNSRDQIKRAGFNSAEITQLISHCAKGLAYVHQQNLAHMDVKPANIFLQIENNICTYKIGDLGLVCPFNEKIFDEGDCRYAAKEVIEDMQLQKQENDLRRADVFSLGLTMLQAATLIKLPNNGGVWHELRNSSSRYVQIELQNRSNLSPSIQSLILCMTRDCPVERVTSQQILDKLNPDHCSKCERYQAAEIQKVEQLKRHIRFLEERPAKRESSAEGCHRVTNHIISSFTTI